MSGEIKAFSLNVNGLRDNIKRKRLKTLLHKLRPEVVLLQETHLKQTSNVVLQDKVYLFQWHSYGTSKSRGTAILLHRSVQFQEDAVLKDTEGRYIAIRGTLNGEKVTIASIYAPNVAQVSFLNDVFQKLTEFGEGALIFGSDYNYISDLKYDRSYAPSDATIFQNSSFTALHNSLQTYGLVDSWRYLYPFTKDYTFYSARHKVYTHIDVILISQGNREAILEAEIGLQTISDHSWTICTLRLGDTPPLQQTLVPEQKLTTTRLCERGGS